MITRNESRRRTLYELRLNEPAVFSNLSLFVLTNRRRQKYVRFRKEIRQTFRRGDIQTLWFGIGNGACVRRGDIRLNIRGEHVRTTPPFRVIFGIRVSNTGGGRLYKICPRKHADVPRTCFCFQWAFLSLCAVRGPQYSVP